MERHVDELVQGKCGIKERILNAGTAELMNTRDVIQTDGDNDRYEDSASYLQQLSAEKVKINVSTNQPGNLVDLPTAAFKAEETFTADTSVTGLAMASATLVHAGSTPTVSRVPVSSTTPPEPRHLAPPIVAPIECDHIDRGFASDSSSDDNKTPTGQWTFNYTRLNLHVAKLAAESGGCVIVDSTRKADKRFPDSMSGTIPVWCGVLNALVFGSDGPALESPPWMSTAQASSMAALVQSVVKKMPLSIRDVIVSSLSGVLVRPLRPVWVVPCGDSLEWLGGGSDALLSYAGGGEECPFTPVVLLSCSGDGPAAVDGRSWQYVKGAGNNEEM
ncbi:unnamed protein product, partial [Symbiodinium microadriaticum]